MASFERTQVVFVEQTYDGRLWLWLMQNNQRREEENKEHGTKSSEKKFLFYLNLHESKAN